MFIEPKMHENKSLMYSIQIFSNNKNPRTLGGHNFLILAQNQLLEKPINALAQEPPNFGGS